jgi:hypothetical protein
MNIVNPGPFAKREVGEAPHAEQAQKSRCISGLQVLYELSYGAIICKDIVNPGPFQKCAVASDKPFSSFSYSLSPLRLSHPRQFEGKPKSSHQD